MSLCHTLSIRTVVIMGAALLVVACTIASFAVDVTLIVVVFGCVGGFGQGCVLISGPMIVHLYFDRWRPFAHGLLYTGVGAAAALGPLAAYATLDAFKMPKVGGVGFCESNCCSSSFCSPPTMRRY